MTVRCGGGTSAAKPGFDQVVLGAGLITAGLGLVAPWLLPVGVLIDAFVFDAASQCAGDPPPMPPSADLALTNVLPGGILNPNFGIWRDAVKSLLLNWAWVQYCECTSGALVPPTYPNPPAQQAPAPTGVAPCLSGHWSGLVTVKNTTGLLGDFNSLMGMFPAQAGLSVVSGSHTITAIPIPPGATSITWSGVGTSYGTGIGDNGVNAAVGFDTWNSAGTHVDGLDLVLWSTMSGLSFRGTKALTAGAKYFYMSAVTSNDPGNPLPSALDLTIQFNCGPDVGTSDPCCPPDPGLLTAIQQLYQLVMSVYQGLPHQLNSYATAAVHSGLSGNGSITLVGAALAIRVNITADPGSLGVDFGHPDFLFDRGYIVPIVNAAPIRAESRLVYNPQMFPLPALTEQIGYSLHPGVTISITELVRGP